MTADGIIRQSPRLKSGGFVFLVHTRQRAMPAGYAVNPQGVFPRGIAADPLRGFLLWIPQR
jgi:hypothetical protein